MPAAKSGESLRPTVALIFGNPKVGTALMKSAQSIGLDLPIRVVAAIDRAGLVEQVKQRRLQQVHDFIGFPVMADRRAGLALTFCLLN